MPKGIKNYLIDIDGTITEDVPNEEPERMSTCLPFEDALETCNKWYDEGHMICFFTSRVEEHRKDNGRMAKQTWIQIPFFINGKTKKEEIIIGLTTI